MNETDFDNFRETHGGKCSVRLADSAGTLDGIISEVEDSVEILLGGVTPKVAFSLRLKKSALKSAGASQIRALLKKTIYLTDSENGMDAARFVVLSARSHPASAIAHFIIREA